MARKKIDGFSAALIVTAPSLRAAVAAVPGIGRARVADLRAPDGDFIKAALGSFFVAEEDQRAEVTGRIKRSAPEAARVAIDLARALWQVALIDPDHAQGEGVRAESRHVVSNSYKWAAEGVVVRASLRWAPGSDPKGSLSYHRENARSVSHGAGWEYRVITNGDKSTGVRLKAIKSWGGTLTLMEM